MLSVLCLFAEGENDCELSAVLSKRGSGDIDNITYFVNYGLCRGVGLDGYTNTYTNSHTDHNTFANEYPHLYTNDNLDSNTNTKINVDCQTNQHTETKLYPNEYIYSRSDSKWTRQDRCISAKGYSLYVLGKRWLYMGL